MCIQFRHKTFMQADIRFGLTLKARVRIFSALCAQFRRSEPFSTDCMSTQQPTAAELDLQRREAIIQGADAIMKISNDAAKEFDKTVLTAMLKVTTCQACLRPPHPLIHHPAQKFKLQRFCFWRQECSTHSFPQFQDMHRLLEMREAALIDAARASMLAKVTNLQAQCASAFSCPYFQTTNLFFLPSVSFFSEPSHSLSTAT